MEFLEALKTRKSIRGFKAKAVPRELIARILEAARWTPSWGNTQPWELVVVQGDKLRELTGEMAAALQQRVAPNPDVPMPDSFPDAYQDRYMAMRTGLFDKMGLSRDDKTRRQAHMANMTRAFGAPVIIYVIFHASLGEPYTMFDLGAITHAICLAAHDLGLGTCIAAKIARHPDLIRRHLGLTTAHKIVLGIILGYPDMQAPANAFRTGREPLEEFVRWIE